MNLNSCGTELSCTVSLSQTKTSNPQANFVASHTDFFILLQQLHTNESDWRVTWVSGSAWLARGTPGKPSSVRAYTGTNDARPNAASCMVAFACSRVRLAQMLEQRHQADSIPRVNVFLLSSRDLRISSSSLVCSGLCLVGLRLRRAAVLMLTQIPLNRARLPNAIESSHAS